MSTERLVKWGKESKEFFEKAEDKSLVLDLVISYACASQTGEGFEELVNAINSQDIKRKVKKVIITDTSFLYRYDNPGFSKYADPNIPTEWYLKNKEAIEKLEVDRELKSWANDVNSEEFKKWYKKIMIDFAGDENGNNIILEFRDQVIKEATLNAYKHETDIKGCINFILEECAHACVFFRNAVVVYPEKPTLSVEKSMQINYMKFNHLHYKISEASSKRNKKLNNRVALDVLDKEISLFMREKVTNVNFYVVDKYGIPIYQNNAFANIIKNKNNIEIDSKSWEISKRVMRERKQEILEEEFQGTTYLSVKAPLVVKGEVEGVIGLAVDITDRKKKEELEKEIEVKEKLYKIATEVAHDVCSPLTALEMVRYMSLDKLEEKERKMFELSTRRIKEITKKLIDEYRHSNNKKETVVEKEQDYIMPSGMKDLIESMRYRYQGRGIEFKFSEDQRAKFAFIKGEYGEFSRMMTNVIKNGVEALEGKFGVSGFGGGGRIEVGYEVKGEEVEIRVKDNGEGMPKEMAGKLMKWEEIGTTKKEGHGIGTQQIMGTIKAMKGKVEIESKGGEGTEFILRFQKSERPRWFEDKIEIKKGEEVVILDDEMLIHEVWREKLKEYEKEIEVKYFTQGLEALKYLNSLGNKEKVFLIADYELRNQEVTGINVIEKSGMKERHIMVTNAYLVDIKDFEKKSEYLKIFPKMHINDVTIVYKT